MSLEKTIITSRLEVRAPCESDRTRFIEDSSSATTSWSSLAELEAWWRPGGGSNHMHAMCEVIGFAKQPIIEPGLGRNLGYTGVDHFTLEGAPRLEWGYRLVPSSEEFRLHDRGKPRFACSRR